MDVKNYLKNRALWIHSQPRVGTDRSQFDQAVEEGNTVEIKSYSPGVYVSNYLPQAGGGYDPKALGFNLRATGYFLTERLFDNPKWKGDSRLQDLMSWASEEKHLKKLMVGNEPYYLSEEKPSSFEWVLWQTKAVAADVQDPNMPLDVKNAEVGILREEIKRLSEIWSNKKSTTKSAGDNVLNRTDRRSKEAINSTLKFIFGALSVPSASQFFPEFNPEMLGTSVRASIELDERYQKPSDLYVEARDPFFDEEEDLEEESIVPDISDEKRQLAKQCLTSFFIFEQGSQIITTLREAKLQEGLRTITPNEPLDIPKEVQEKFNLPKGVQRETKDGFGQPYITTAQLSYTRSIQGVPDPETGKSTRSYVFNKVDADGQVLTGQENEVLVSKEAYDAIRHTTSPALQLPEGFPAARYLNSKRKGNYPNQVLTYFYMGQDNKVFPLSREQHKEVMKLNPSQSSVNTRGRIDNLFTDFFVDDVKPHYRGYLPESREERILLRDNVREALEPHIAKAWDELSKTPDNLEVRTEIAKSHYSNWLQAFQLPEMQAVAPKLFIEMKQQQVEAIGSLVSKKANEAALVGYMEEMRGKNEAPNYEKYGLRGKFKTWRTQIQSDGGAKAMNERMAAAAAWAERKFGGLDALVPDTHKGANVLAHFTKGAGEELRETLEKRGIPQAKGLVGQTKYVNPVSILVFFERRLQHLDWNFHFDQPLPEVNLSKLAKMQQAEKLKSRKPEQPAEEQSQTQELGLDVGM